MLLGNVSMLVHVALIAPPPWWCHQSVVQVIGSWLLSLECCVPTQDHLLLCHFPC